MLQDALETQRTHALRLAMAVEEHRIRRHDFRALCSVADLLGIERPTAATALLVGFLLDRVPAASTIAESAEPRFTVRTRRTLPQRVASERAQAFEE